MVEKDTTFVPLDEVDASLLTVIDTEGNEVQLDDVPNEEDRKIIREAAMLEKLPSYRRHKKKVQKALGNLERSRPNMPMDERLALAVKIALQT
jgi:hypothetical protein